MVLKSKKSWKMHRRKGKAMEEMQSMMAALKSNIDTFIERPIYEKVTYDDLRKAP